MKTDIGERIRQQRVLKGFSQEYMANELEISTSAYSNIETGKTDITVKRAIEIAVILGINVVALIADTPQKTSFQEPDSMGYQQDLEALKIEIENIKKLLGKKSSKKKS